MNHLAHFYLAKGSDALILGAWLGDFVRGPLQGDFPADIEAGIRLHRLIDSHTDQHDLTRDMRRQFSPTARRYSGIALDIVFDHLLALYWPEQQVGLDDFGQRVYKVLRSRASMPVRARVAALRFGRYRVLGRTADVVFPERALGNIARRLSRPMPLQEVLAETQRLMPQINQCFEAFWPELQAYVASTPESRL